MRHALLTTCLLAAPSLMTNQAHAHGTGLAHTHPHSDWQMMLVVAAALGVGAIALLSAMRVRQTVLAKSNKDRRHERG